MRFHKTAVIVLGQLLYRNGTLPGSLLQRVVETREVLTQLSLTHQINSTASHNEVHLIYSGGNAEQTGNSEAQHMQETLRSIMLGEELQSFTFCSHLEERSRNTVENALNCREILEELTMQQRSDENRDSKDSNNANCSDGSGAGSKEEHGASFKSCVYLVTNEFHMPRARLIFESVLLPSLSSHNDNDDNFDRIQFPYSLVCCPASSGLPCDREYRPVHLRPTDANQWRLCERLDWEVSALESINQYLQLGEYKLGPISQKRIDQALEELRSLNDTIALSFLPLRNETPYNTDSSNKEG